MTDVAILLDRAKFACSKERPLHASLEQAKAWYETLSADERAHVVQILLRDDKGSLLYSIPGHAGGSQTVEFRVSTQQTDDEDDESGRARDVVRGAEKVIGFSMAVLVLGVVVVGVALYAKRTK